MIRIIKPGMSCSIQDLGRFGFRHSGIPISGVMDEQSAGLANLLLDNNHSEAVMEIGLIGPELEFFADTWICFTGAVKKVLLNGLPIEWNSIIKIYKTDILHIGSGKNGVWSYLAVKGGFQTPSHLNSRSSYPVAKLGTPTFNKGLELPIFSISGNFDLSKNSRIGPYTNYYSPNIIRALKGPEYGKMQSNDFENVLNAEYTIGKNSNRMGYYLEGHKVSLKRGSDILTSAVAPGTIQLPPSGIPIVLMKDAQTTGGYLRIFQVVKRDLDLLAQKRTGEKIELVLVDE